MKTLRLIAAAAPLFVAASADASAPTSDQTLDWALKLANGEQQVAYYCTTTCQYNEWRQLVCTQRCH